MRTLLVALVLAGLPVDSVRSEDQEKRSRAVIERQIENRKGKVEVLRGILRESQGEKALEIRVEIAGVLLELQALGCDELEGEHVVDLARDQVYEILSASPEHGVARRLLTLLENHDLTLPVENDGGEAGRAYEEGKYEEAIRRANSMRSGGRETSAALDLVQSSSHFLLWEFDEARRHASHAVQKDPNQFQAIRLLAKCDERAGDLKGALGGYLSALVIDPGYQAAWQDLSWVARHSKPRRKVERVRLAPRADIRQGEEGKLSIVVESGERNPTMNSWLAYAMWRMRWRREFFALRYPGLEYRRTYREEYEAWSKVLEVWKYYQQQDPTLIDPDLDRLTTIEDHLAAYVYIERWRPTFSGTLDAEGGPTRDQVRRYLTEIVLVER